MECIWIWVCVMFFSWFHWDDFFRRDTLFISSYLGQVDTWCHHVLAFEWLILDYLTTVMFAKFLHCKVNVFHLFYNSLSGSKVLSIAHAQGMQESCFIALRNGYLQKLLGIPLEDDYFKWYLIFFSSLPFMCLIIPYISMDSCIFILHFQL